MRAGNQVGSLGIGSGRGRKPLPAAAQRIKDAHPAHATIFAIRESIGKGDKLIGQPGRNSIEIGGREGLGLADSEVGRVVRQQGWTTLAQVPV